VWAFLGWDSEALVVSYSTPPRVLSCAPLNRAQGAAPRIESSSAWHQLPTPVLVEVYVSRVLDRDEFRAHGDRHRTRSAILENLA
jgi:hypothetical protein